MAVAVALAGLLIPSSSARAAGSMFDSSYVVPYYWTDPDTGETYSMFTLDLPQPIDYNMGDTTYVAHHLKEYYDWKTKTYIRTLPSFWETEYRKTITTDNVKTLRDLQVGEHYYHVDRVGEIPIGNWVMEHTPGRCIHSGNQKTAWRGLSIGDSTCNCVYWSGWIPYCVDCGEQIETALIYAPEEAISTIKYMNTNYGYYYICQNPACKHLENEGYVAPHVCKAISPNMYEVIYNENGTIPHPTKEGEFLDVDGTMLPSFHMYNNATEYEGKEIEPVTHLTENSYSRNNYTFVGWNTEKDGSGTFFTDGQEILNLTEYNYKTIDGLIDERGVVTLYAQWVPTESTLKIDPKQGSYDGNEGVSSFTQGYGTNYFADPDKVTPKSIHKVSYNTHGGNSISPDSVPRKFSSWKQEAPFNGKMKEDKYYFVAPNGNVDTLTALYENLPITLPTPVKDGYVFGGWYEDEECTTTPVGFGGDPYLASGNVTLHASWSKLTLWSFDDYVSNNKKGAADLKWQQDDTYVKTYKLYRSLYLPSNPGVTDFKQISADGAASLSSVSKDYAYNGANRTYTIPSTGFYEITINGAQGGDFTNADGTHTGGLGGSVTAKFYLKKGDVLTVTVGGRSGFGGGGTADAYGKGGGATTVTSANEGLLMVAGGGGGATEFANGEPGGAETSLVSSGSSGENGSAGGGGGYLGGKAGNVVRHYHNDECKVDHVHSDACYTIEKHKEICYVTGGTYKDSETDRHSHDCDIDGTAALVHTEFVYAQYNGSHSACGASNYGGKMANDANGDSIAHYGYWYCKRCERRECPVGNKYDCGWFSGTSHEYTVGVQKLTCGIDAVNGCKYGYTDGQVINSSVAYGGSSFVSEKAVSKSTEKGVNSGDGSFSIQSKGIGMSDANVLNDVPANDLEAPDAVEVGLVRIDTITSSVVEVYWEEPKDNGTTYLFRAESYNAEDGTKLCDSNVTRNTLTTGVAGYYYRFNTTPSETVTDSNAINAGVPYAQTHVQCTLTSDVMYLHLAPVDVAGNVGPTTDVRLEIKDISWAVKTKQVEIDTFNPTDDNVYDDGAGKIWVRADGYTPVKLSFNSYIDGTATDDYQITEQEFYVAHDSEGEEYKFRTNVGTSSVTLSGFANLPVANFKRFGSGLSTILIDSARTGSTRGVYGTQNTFFQGFSIPVSESGKKIVVTPGAGAGGDSRYKHSIWSDDVTHSLTIYPDGEAPAISGNQDFASMTVINESTIANNSIEFTASDALSGLRSLSVKVINQDNGATRTALDDDGDGKVSFAFDPTTALFDGDVVFEVVSYDNVGNRSIAVYGKAEYTLTAEVFHAGYNPTGATTFKRGDPAVLHAETTGYADTIKIEVPDALKSGYPVSTMTEFYGLIAYRTPVYANFVVPDDCPAGNYTFIVHSYKNGVELEAKPAMITIVDGDSSYGDVRIRLR